MRSSKQMKHSTQNLVSISLTENLQGKYLNLYWIKSKHYLKILFSYKQSSNLYFFTVIEINLLTLVKNVQQVMKRTKAVPNLMFCNLTGNDLYLKLTTVNTPPPPRKKLKFLPLKQSGMTVCADHWRQKKGFDSLTGKCQIYLWLFIFLKITVTLVGLYFICK